MNTSIKKLLIAFAIVIGLGATALAPTALAQTPVKDDDYVNILDPHPTPDDGIQCDVPNPDGSCDAVQVITAPYWLVTPELVAGYPDNYRVDALFSVKWSLGAALDACSSILGEMQNEVTSRVMSVGPKTGQLVKGAVCAGVFRDEA